ncbi:predicted protein [Naegleria gruberi]|uniref:Predicted protein n=1 Tax=Naegleria gruberi TaxID=5762 RepID=D2V1E3_NAEGR|nr:uncharacterized protein NAEGRDRAFT_30267 [Naegleria gruberi]EFC49291.1 predicted protein [Naegleria gruberi]|eukprot:XP_002682035.1 predicted protein [Naegleria gruberi strain NEG-M]
MVPWIYNVFGECVHSPLEQASFYVGLVSIALWMCALFPQIIANFKNRDASSLSAGFLAQNVMGDASNLLACVLSGQLITQILLASYFVSMDFILVFQYLYYVVWLQKIRGRKVEKKEEQVEDKKSIEISPISSSSLNLSNVTSSQMDDFEDVELKSTQLQSSKVVSLFIILLLDFVFPPNTVQGIIGYTIGCICAIMYVGSRLPQIYWNFSRKSTDGLSPTYFSIGIFGNMCYLTSIWLYSVQPNYLLGRLPWLTESTINIFLDCLILSQYYYYTHFKRGSFKYSDLESKGVIPATIENEKENHRVASIDESSLSSVTFNEVAAMHELAKHLPDENESTSDLKILNK